MECKCCMPTSAPQTLDDAASQLHAAGTGSRKGLHNHQGACQGGGGERGEEEVDCVGQHGIQWPRSSV